MALRGDLILYYLSLRGLQFSCEELQGLFFSRRSNLLRISRRALFQNTGKRVIRSTTRRSPPIQREIIFPHLTTQLIAQTGDY